MWLLRRSCFLYVSEISLIKVASLKQIHHPKIRLLQSGLFERIRMVEQVGSCISRMRDLMLEEDLTPPEFNTEGIFR